MLDKVHEKANLLKLEAYNKAIADLQWQALKIELQIAFNRYEGTTSFPSTVIHLTTEAERILDTQFDDTFKDRDWEKELGPDCINIHTAREAGIGAWRASGSTLFGRRVVWDANHVMVGDGDSISINQ